MELTEHAPLLRLVHFDFGVLLRAAVAMSAAAAAAVPVASSTAATATGPEVRHLVFELLALKDVQLVQDELQALRVERTVLVQVPACKHKGPPPIPSQVGSKFQMKLLHERRRGGGGKNKRTGLGQDAFIDLKQSVQRALVDVQAGQVGQKVVADKDVDEDKVVDDALEVVLERERRLERAKLVVEVLAEEREVHQVKVLVLEAVPRPRFASVSDPVRPARPAHAQRLVVSQKHTSLPFPCRPSGQK